MDDNERLRAEWRAAVEAEKALRESYARSDAADKIAWSSQRFHVTSATGTHAEGILSQLRSKGIYVDKDLGEQAIKNGSVDLPAHMHEKAYADKKLKLRAGAYGATKVSVLYSS